MPQQRGPNGQFLPNPQTPAPSPTGTPGPPSPPPPPPPQSGRQFGSSGTSAQGGLNTYGAVTSSWAGGASANAATQGILSGLQSVATRAWNVGANIGESLLRGILSGPLGRSGQALSSIGGNLIGAAQGVAGAGLKIGVGAVGAAAQVAGSAVTLPLNLASGILGGVGGIVSGAIPGVGAIAGGLLSGIGGIIGQISQSLTSLFEKFLAGVTNLVSTVGDALGKIGEAGGAIFNSLLEIFSDVVDTAKQVSRQVRSISLNAGISPGQAGRVFNAFQFGGGDTQALANAYAQPMGALTIGMRARILGLPDPTVDPEGFLAGNAARRQSMHGPIGQAIYNGLAGPLAGIAGDSAGMSQAQLQRNFALSRSFELPKGTLELGSDATAVSAAFSALGQNLKLVLGSVLVPLLPRLNQAFSWLIQNKDSVIGAITTVGSYLVNELPKMILHGGAFILRGVGTVMEMLGTFLVTTFQDIGKGILSNLPAILSGIDSFVNGLIALAGISAGLVTGLAQAAMNAGITLPSGAGGGGGSISPGVKAAAMRGANAGNGGAGNGGFAPGASNYSNYQQSPYATTNGSGGFWARAGATLAGAAGGAFVGTGVAPGVGTLVGAVLGGYAAWQATRVAQNKATQVFDPAQAAADGLIPSPGGSISPRLRAGARAANQGQSNAQILAAMQNANAGASANSMLPQPGRSVGDAFAAGQSWVQGLGVTANISQYQNQIGKAIGSITSGGKDAGNWLLDNKDKPNDLADSLDKMADNWGPKLDAIKDAVNRNTDMNSKSQQDAMRDLFSMIKGISSRTAAFIAEDEGANALRV